MIFLKRLGLFVVVVIVLLVAGAYLLPRTVTVERTAQIDAPPEAVFPHVNSLKATEAWSPWLDRDPDVALTYEGPDEGVGARMTWASDDPNVGNGTQEITLSTANERVESALDFGDMGSGDAWFALAPANGGTEITWGLNADMGNNPIGRWMGLMMDRWVGGDYEKGLANLKQLAETDDEG